METEWFRDRSECSLENWDRIREELNDALISHGLTRQKATRFLVGCEEIYVNILDYAWQGISGERIVGTSLSSDDRGFLVVTFADRGKPFNPLDQPERPPVSGTMAADLAPGGWGIQMARDSADLISYQRKNGWNILQMKIKTDSACQTKR